MINKWFSLFFIVLSFSISAQNKEDALRFGNDQIMGSARFVSMAGGMGALGGEVSAVGINPGGIGVFRRGQFASSITVGNQQFNTNHYGSALSSNRGFGRLSNLAVVLSGEAEHPDWEYINSYFGYNQQTVYNSNYKAEGVNPESSLLDRYFVDIIEDPEVTVESVTEFFPFGAGLAWGAFLIDTLNGEYIYANEHYGQIQGVEDKEKRGQGHYSFGVGANYRNKLYLGASLGFTSLRYISERKYYEQLPENNPNTFLKDWSQTSNLIIRGNGTQLKLGAILRLNKVLRLGFAFKTSEYFRLKETYTTSVQANWTDRPSTFADSPESVNEYRLRSPYMLAVSFGAAKKDIGAVNLDIEYVDNRAIQFNSWQTISIDFTDVNNDLQVTLKPTINARLGLEKTIGPLSIRAGYGYREGIQQTTLLTNQHLGGGVGMRINQFSFDIAYAHAWTEVGERNIHFADKIKLQPTNYQQTLQQFVASMVIYFD